jgi:hypothetical protein
MKLHIVEINRENLPCAYGVWPNDGRPAFGRKPLAVFETQAEALAYVEKGGAL